jgi:prepilin-type N-terminal cleavage/methylation domain-containing protein
MRSTRRTERLDEAGFTLLEVLVVVALMGVLASMAIMVSPAFTQTARSDAALTQMLDALRSAREVAISQRRNVQLQFIGLNAIQTAREEINSSGVVTGTTVLRTVELENRMQFRLDSTAPIDTPDGFGRTAAVSFPAASPWRFTSEGTFVGPTGDVLNGTVFLSIANQANSARAVTIMGATALIRSWRWNGREWVE